MSNHYCQYTPEGIVVHEKGDGQTDRVVGVVSADDLLLSSHLPVSKVAATLADFRRRAQRVADQGDAWAEHAVNVVRTLARELGIEDVAR